MFGAVGAHCIVFSIKFPNNFTILLAGESGRAAGLLWEAAGLLWEPIVG
jgi:hypothetical protein